MALETKDIIALVVAALLAGILLPIGLTDLVNVGNYLVGSETVGNITTYTYFSDIAPASIITLLGVVVPIIIVIGVMMSFLKNR